MADTWRAVGNQIAFGNLKSMLDIFNATGSGRVLRVYRCYHWNSVPALVAGVLTTMQLRRTITGSSGGVAVTPVKHATTNAALHANVTAGTGRTTTDSDLFRQYTWENDDSAMGNSTISEWELMMPYTEIWNAGHGEEAVQPVTCRENQGFHIKHAGSTVIGNNDFEIEFTNASS